MRDEQDGPDLPVKELTFARLFAPYLKREPSHQDRNYLLDMAWQGFFLQVGKDEIRSMLFVEWMCGRLAQSNPKEAGELLAFIFQEDYDSTTRMARAEHNLTAAEEDTGKWLAAALDLYKVYFESEFRLWATIPFCFTSKYFGLKTHSTSPADIVHIGASEKFNSLKNIKIDVPQGDLSKLIAGFDNNIRNSGAGHDRWELSDKDTIVLSIRDPKSGREKGAERIELSVSDLRKLIDQVRKTIWILRMGTVIFSINRPEVASQVPRNKEVKIKEIEVHVRSFAKDRWLSLDSFNCTQDRTSVDLTLKYSPGMGGVGGSVISGGGEGFDLISIESTEPYATQVMGVVQFMLAEFFNREKLPDVKLTCLNEKGVQIGQAHFHPPELQKLFQKPKSMPMPTNGELPAGTYRMQDEVRVPYGRRNEYIELVKSKMGPNMRVLG